MKEKTYVKESWIRKTEHIYKMIEKERKYKEKNEKVCIIKKIRSVERVKS